jgi:ferritin-like metal-binding protein YciE
MRDFERAYMRTLRHAYDTEKQLAASARSLAGAAGDASLANALAEIESQSARQITRLEGIFRLLYMEPQAEPSWVATALLREALECCAGGHGAGTQGCAAALLAVKRYEITLYEALLRWSEHCDLVEVLADIRRSIAEELVQASVLSELAFEQVAADGSSALARAERSMVH